MLFHERAANFVMLGHAHTRAHTTQAYNIPKNTAAVMKLQNVTFYIANKELCLLLQAL